MARVSGSTTNLYQGARLRDRRLYAAPSEAFAKQTAVRLKMAHLGGESSNTLFDILAQWNQVLSAIQIPANAPERDICGVAG